MNPKQGKDNFPKLSDKKNTDRIMLITFIVLAANQRGTFIGVGTLVPLIRDDLGINNTVAGMITTLPLLIFIFISPQAASISRRFGLGRTLLVAFYLILIALPIRSSFGIFGLFTGTAILAVGLGLGNVLLFSLIKLRFPDKVGIVTGIYSTAMATTAAISVGVSVPVATSLGFGWKVALVMWVVVSFPSVILWHSRMRNEEVLKSAQPITEADKSYDKIVYKIPRAWCFAFCNGMQVLLFYAITAWLPSIMHTRGYTLEQAAGFALYFQLISLPSTLIVPILCGRRNNQKSIILIIGSMFVLGMVMFSLVHGLILDIVAITIAAVAQGGAFAITNTFVSLRVDNAQQSAALSGMIQTMGFIIASLAPTFMGLMFDMTNSWNIPYIMMIVVASLWFALGLPLAKNKSFFEGY